MRANDQDTLLGQVGTNVAHELHVTERMLVAIDDSAEALARFRERFPGIAVVHGDASDDEILEKPASLAPQASSRSPATTARTC